MRRGGSPAVGPAAHTCITAHSSSTILLYIVTLSPCLPPTFSFHPRPTFLKIVVGVVIQHGAQCKKHKGELGQILHAVQITLEVYTPSQSTVLFTHPAPQVCFLLLLGPLVSLHQLSQYVSSLTLLLHQTHTLTHTHTPLFTYTSHYCSGKAGSLELPTALCLISLLTAKFLTFYA